MKRLSVNTKWFETKEECRAMLTEREKHVDVWGVDILKVNKANRTYNHGFTVRWEEFKKKEVK